MAVDEEMRAMDKPDETGESAGPFTVVDLLVERVLKLSVVQFVEFQQRVDAAIAIGIDEP